MVDVAEVNDLIPSLRWSQEAFESDVVVAAAEREALLREFSLQRVMAYGMELGDALALLSGASRGVPWTGLALKLAERVNGHAERASDLGDHVTARQAWLRTAACLRMAQIVMSSDSDERTAIWEQATSAFGRAFTQDPNVEQLRIPHTLGDLYAWLFEPAGHPDAPVVLVVGGMEGWAEDSIEVAECLNTRGIAALLIDGPGQGTTRMRSKHYLTARWADAFSTIVDYLERIFPRPRQVAIWGNSLGGTFAIQVAVRDDRIVACCDNGGPLRPIILRDRVPRKFAKLASMCGPVDDDQVDNAVRTLDLDSGNASVTCPVLVVHGEHDPLVSRDQVDAIYDLAQSEDKRLYAFADGDHCIYNHPADKLAVIGDWFAEQLVRKR